MKKMIFKKILGIIDIVEIRGVPRSNLQKVVIKELSRENITNKEIDLTIILPYLFKLNYVKEIAKGIDLSPCATIFAKADSNSQVEALAIFECLFQNKQLQPCFLQLLDKTIHKVDFLSKVDELSYSLLIQSSLFDEDQGMLCYHKSYLQNIHQIMESYTSESPLLSITLCALYTASIVAHKNQNVEYRNQDNELVDYDEKQNILNIIPRRGVPCDRNETKSLQSFYKDTLFHECKHICPICGIDFPHLLIASHIKPFRDCAHLYEAIDHNNGLLLCRNHDYLFDQGYFSFHVDGSILLSTELQEKDNAFAYALSDNYHLPAELLSKERQLFMEYHRKNIFKNG